MLFNSLIFILFGIIFFSFYWLVKAKSIKLTWIYLVAFSFFFYGWWDWRFLFLIVGSGLIDFFAGMFIYRWKRFGKVFLILSIIGNLGTLFAFKYSVFILTEIEKYLQLFNIHSELTRNLPEFLSILPIGISFYTFQSMSYTIDIYKNCLKPTKNIFHFFAYLSMFPQLVAGPIVRSSTLLPQLMHPRRTTETERWHGAKLIAIGFFKKMLLADNIAPLVNTAFSNVNQTTNSGYWWLIIIGFAFQIYCDFSGYSDIARGLAKLMGFHFKNNFNHPYIAKSFKDFWQRWHISLSSWFRDYVYIPLGGSKKGKFRSHLNMWITMILSGFWHGASWNFIIWGALHALYLSLERILKWPNWFKGAFSWIAILIVMFQVLVSWVFFRAANFHDAITIIKNLLDFDIHSKYVINDDIRNGFYYILTLIVIEYGFLHLKLRYLFKQKPTRQFAEVVLIAILISLTIFLRGKGDAFIYFQF